MNELIQVQRVVKDEDGKDVTEKKDGKKEFVLEPVLFQVKHWGEAYIGFDEIARVPIYRTVVYAAHLVTGKVEQILPESIIYPDIIDKKEDKNG